MRARRDSWDCVRVEIRILIRARAREMIRRGRAAVFSRAIVVIEALRERDLESPYDI